MTENRAFLTQLKSLLNIYDTPDPAKVLGMDTSHWTGIVDWHMAKAAGIKFAMIKFMNGTTKTKYAEENYRGAKDADILVGGYTWLYRSANISAGRQAREYLAMLKDHPCEIRPTVDFEWTSWNYLPSNPTYTDLYGFAMPFEDGYGDKPMIYTAPGYWMQYGSKMPIWAQYQLWKAQYRVAKPDPILPWGEAYKFWQFTGNGDGEKIGQNPLISKSADLNYWNGTLAELYAWCKAVPATEEPPEEPPIVLPGVSREAVVVVPSLRIRAGMGTGFDVIGGLVEGEKVTVYLTVFDDAGNEWANIGIGKWACMTYLGEDYIQYVDEISPVVVPPVVAGKLIDEFTVPEMGTWAQPLRDDECSAWGYLPRSPDNYKAGLPMTIPLRNKLGQFFPLSKEWQFWWYELLRLASYGQFSEDKLLAKWGSLTADSRAWTDNHAIQNGKCDYVQGINLGAAPIAIKSLTCCGLLKVLGINGRLLTIECLNYSKAPPPLESVWLKKPWLYFWAASATWVKLPNKTYVVTPFPQMAPYGTPVPLGSMDGTQVISKDYAKLLVNRKKYRIYNP